MTHLLDPGEAVPWFARMGIQAKAESPAPDHGGTRHSTTIPPLERITFKAGSDGPLGRPVGVTG